MIEACTTLNSRTDKKIEIMRNLTRISCLSLISRSMYTLTKFVCLFLPLLLLSSCSKYEEPDYPTVASSIFNDVLIDVLDSEGNSLIDNEAIMNGLSFIGRDGYKIPFHTVEIGDEKIIRTVFPLPMESSMSYSDDRKEGYGESNLTVNVNGFKFNLRGKFHYTCTYPNMYGGNGIKIIEIHSNNPNVSISEDANFLKITIKIASD